MWVIYFIMRKNKKPPNLDCIEDIFKPFVNDHDEVEISEIINHFL